MGAFASYGEVYNWVQSRAGGCISTPEDAEVELRKGLLTVRDMLGFAEEPVYQNTFTVAGAESIAIPPQIVVVTRIRRLDGHYLTEGEVTPGPDDFNDRTQAAPQRFVTTQGRIWFRPIPDKAQQLLIEGWSAQSCSIKDETGWLPIALPEGLDAAYAEIVLSCLLADSAPSRAAIWNNLAMTKIANWKERRLSNPDRFVMAGTDTSDYPFYDHRTIGNKVVFDVIDGY